MNLVLVKWQVQGNYKKSSLRDCASHGILLRSGLQPLLLNDFISAGKKVWWHQKVWCKFAAKLKNLLLDLRCFGYEEITTALFLHVLWNAAHQPLTSGRALGCSPHILDETSNLNTKSSELHTKLDFWCDAMELWLLCLQLWSSFKLFFLLWKSSWLSWAALQGLLCRVKGHIQGYRENFFFLICLFHL